MKNLARWFFLGLLMPFMLIGMNSCGKKDTESRSIAEDKNSEKFNTKPGERDAQFVVEAVSASYAEISLAEVAEKRSIDKEVKDVASMLKNEHSTMLKALNQYAMVKGISVPTEATDKIQKKVDDLNSARNNFDRKWCGEVRDLHKETIEEFEKAATTVADLDLKSWANDVLPGIRIQHDKIMACHERLK